MNIAIQIDERGRMPEYATPGSAGADLRAAIENPAVIYPGERKAISTGLSVAIPNGFEMQIRSRSGLALNYGVVVANAPGTVDSDYRGEVRVILTNISDQPWIVCPGDRIAQAIIAPVCQAKFVLADALQNTERGNGGFGSTGSK